MQANIKGLTLINCIAVARQLAGAARFGALVDSCPDSTQQLVRRTILAVEWLPVDTWAPFLLALYEQLAGREEGRFRRLMRAVFKRDFSSVYRVYVSEAAPLDVLARSENIWRAYFDSGSLGILPAETIEGKLQVTLQLRDLQTAFPIYYWTVHACLEELLSMTGSTNAVVSRQKEQRRSRGLSCDYLVAL